jgi:hypothetical protein
MTNHIAQPRPDEMPAMTTPDKTTDTPLIERLRKFAYTEPLRSNNLERNATELEAAKRIEELENKNATLISELQNFFLTESRARAEKDSSQI